MTADKTHETRLRRMAERQGFRLVKSGRRDPRAIDYGRWMIVNPYTNGVVAGVGGTGRPEFTIDDVEAWLVTQYYIDIGTSDRPSIGPAAFLPDLAFQLANVLTVADNQGASRPPWEIRADEDGHERGPTEDEQTAFTSALEQALGELDRGRRTAKEQLTTNRRKEAT